MLGPRSGPDDFARLFQAVRIAVNGEIERLARALPALLEVAAPAAVLAVISYHSGEDREVKVAMRDWARSCICPPGQPVCTCRGRPLGTLSPGGRPPGAGGDAAEPARAKRAAPRLPEGGVKLKGRHWVAIWLAGFLVMAAAVVWRQTEALATVRQLSALQAARGALEATRADAVAAIRHAQSRAVLVPLAAGAPRAALAPGHRDRHSAGSPGPVTR